MAPVAETPAALDEAEQREALQRNDEMDGLVVSRFGALDLTALLKSLEKEIDVTKGLLLDEVEKRKKYRVRLRLLWFFLDF